MKAEHWQEIFNAFDPGEEISVGDVIREKDIMQEAEFQGITCTVLQAQQIIRSMDDRPDNSDSVIEYYLALFEEGELQEADDD